MQAVVGAGQAEDEAREWQAKEVRLLGAISFPARRPLPGIRGIAAGLPWALFQALQLFDFKGCVLQLVVIVALVGSKTEHRIVRVFHTQRIVSFIPIGPEHLP